MLFSHIEPSLVSNPTCPFLTGPGAVTEPHEPDPQGENPPQDDLQPPPAQLPEVPAPILHRSGRQREEARRGGMYLDFGGVGGWVVGVVNVVGSSEVWDFL